MKTKKPTKEELAIELARISDSNAQWVASDERRRKEFAKAFSWFQKKDQYDYNSEPKPSLPSWEQIFVNVGNLLAAKNFMDFEGNISELECKIEDLQKQLNLLHK